MSVEQPSESPPPGETSPDYIRGYRAGLAKGSPAESSRPVPFGRWFFVLLIGTLLTIILPLFADSKDTFVQTNSITTFTEVNGDMQPTSAKIWVDGRTYAFLSGRS